LCLDLQNFGGQGSQVIAWPCHGGLNQQWDYLEDTNVIKSKSGLCLQVQSPGGQGSPVIVSNCDGQSNQKWYFRRDGTIRTSANLCMDVEGGKVVKWARVIVWPCRKPNNANQKWR
jgi:hypothetical protein